MNRKQGRRQFLQQTAAIGAGAWILGPNMLFAQRSANEQVNIACVGVGGKGDSDSQHAGNHGNVVAICDVDDNNLGKKAEKFPKAKKYVDFRKMLEELEKEVDAVTVSTTDHTHAAISLMAMRMKKHVYTQKPLTWSVKEARLLREAAKQYGVVTQMGNQGQALDPSRTSIEVIRSGVIGDIHTVHVWTDRPRGYWKQAPDMVARPTENVPPPSYVHWDEWLGPAPERAFGPAPKPSGRNGQGEMRGIYHPFNWRGWRDFGTGAVGDMSCHLWNVPFKALNLRYPTAVASVNSDVNPETYQQWAAMTFEFPAENGHGPIKLVWYEGMQDGKQVLPPAELLQGEPAGVEGFLLIGSKGTLHCPDGRGRRYTLLPKKNFEGYKAPEPTLPRLNIGDARDGGDDAHKKEWVDAIKANKPEAPLSNFQFAGLLTEAVLLGNVAVLAGKRIEWDGANMKIPNAPEMEKYLHREYRKGWTL